MHLYKECTVSGGKQLRVLLGGKFFPLVHLVILVISHGGTSGISHTITND